MKTGIKLIAQERKEQIKKHGRTIEKDVALNTSNQLVIAAAMLLSSDGINLNPPPGWDEKIWQKMRGKKLKDRLIISGALIAAEIDRLQTIEYRYGWISIREHRPEYMQTCIVHTTLGVVTQAQYGGGSPGKEVFCIGQEWYIVDFWMPLPLPPNDTQG